MSEERFKEVFRRLTAETPDPPAFSDLETQRAKPAAPIRLKPWMAAVGAAVVVLVVVGAFGLLGGGGPDLAAPDEDTINYVKLEYTSTVNPVCEGGEIIDNGGFDQATIEVWGPNSDDLTLMVVTFPDGSTERTMVEGKPGNPDYIWVEGDPMAYPSNTKLRVVQCEGTVGSPGLLDAFSPGSAEGIVPFHMLGPPPGFEGFAESFPGQEPTPTEWNENSVLLYEFRRDEEAGSIAFDLYVTEDDRRALRFHAEQSFPGVGNTVVDYSVVEEDEVPADSVSFAKSGLTAISQVFFGELGPEACPVTIPSQGFTPPADYKATPSDPNLVWFGKDELWTVLSTDGSYQPRKSVWWSVNFPGGQEEEVPPIAVTYRLLNADSDFTIESTEGTNAYTDADGWFMIATIDPQASGCWEVTAVYKDASLTYIYYNPEGQDPPTPTAVVPDVVGMTVDNARRAITGKGFKPFFVDSDEDLYEVCAQDPAVGSVVGFGGAVEMRTAPPGGCEVTDALLDPNPLYDTYQDQFGNVWYATSCPEADVLITGGENGLPRLGQTTKDRVEQVILVEEVEAELAEADFFLGNPGVAALSAVPRNGEVWDRDDNNDVVVTHVADYMIEAIIDDESACPSAPGSWNGIPIAYFKIDSN